MALSPSTWNSLGLGVAGCFAVLGSGTVLLPRLTADTFGMRDALSGSGASDVPHMMSLVGARDLSFATAIFMLGRAGRNEEMGTVILSTMILSALDIYVVWKRDKRLETIVFAVGASIWGIIGLGLRGYFD